MSAIIINEYTELLLQKNKIEKTFPTLPKGYISTKTIKRKQYYYLQNRVNGKITSKYLKENEVDIMKKQVELCKKYKAELPKIEARLNELEQAAKLIDRSIARNLTLLKLSCGMDSLSNLQKERSASFANALNAIEGVYASKTTQHHIDKWKAGDESFISILKSTLNMYGFLAEADITNVSMLAVYNQAYKEFDTKTLQDIHLNIFGQIYDWAGEFRTIQIAKCEDVLGGDAVRYTSPKQIKKELDAAMKEIKKLKRTDGNDKDILFRLERMTATIWQIHPFKDGNARTCIVFAVLLAKHLGLEINHALFKVHSAYVKHALVWASQGMYSKHVYLERIFADVILGDNLHNRMA